MEDIEVILKIKEGGDKFVFNSILDKYEKPLINYLYKFLGSQQDAEDVEQETFLKVYQSIAKYKPTAKFSTYLYRIATNLALNLQRRKKIIQFFYPVFHCHCFFVFGLQCGKSEILFYH